MILPNWGYVAIMVGAVMTVRARLRLRITDRSLHWRFGRNFPTIPVLGK